MPERFKVVCIPCKALYKCSALPSCKFTVAVKIRSSATAEITRRRSLPSVRSFKVTDFGTNRKPVCDFLLVAILTYILSRTVPKSLWIIGHIFAFDRRYLCLTHSFGVKA